ncbi:exported hypothetical protein [Verrucomicrobia bacterium]|nr:exported hypothetical protein [Verrucomicrobiota bacterium]
MKKTSSFFVFLASTASSLGQSGTNLTSTVQPQSNMRMRSVPPGGNAIKGLLSWLLLLNTALFALAQGKVTLQNDPSTAIVLGDCVFPADAEFAGQPVPTTGPLPSGVVLEVGLYCGTDSNSLTWQTAVLLNPPGGTGTAPGIIPPTHKVLIFPGGSPLYMQVMVWDSTYAYPGSVPSGHYVGASSVFTMIPGTGISYPGINNGGGTTMPQTNIVVEGPCNTPPLISSQPQSQSVWQGTPASFTVMSPSPMPFACQWWKNSAMIPNATNTTYSLNAASNADAGTYFAVLTNIYGFSISSNAELQVLPYEAPSISVNNQFAVGTVVADGSAVVTIAGGFTNGFIFYTLDGTAPTTSSALYSGPITLTNSATVQAMSMSQDFSQSVLAPAVIVQIVPAYYLQTSVRGQGIITLSPTNNPYPSNSTVVLTATAATNWAFDHWSGDASGNQNPISITMNGPRNVQAVFAQTGFPLTVSTPGGGSATVNGQTIQPVTYYSAGTVVSLAATPSNNWVFLGWQGDAGGTNNPLSLTITQTNNIQAIFGTIVATNAVGPGEIVLTPPNPVPFGAATVTAVASPGNYFRVWSGAASGTNSPATISVTTPGLSVGALFAAVPAGECTDPVRSTSIRSKPTMTWALR